MKLFLTFILLSVFVNIYSQKKAVKDISVNELKSLVLKTNGKYAKKELLLLEKLKINKATFYDCWSLNSKKIHSYDSIDIGKIFYATILDLENCHIGFTENHLASKISLFHKQDTSLIKISVNKFEVGQVKQDTLYTNYANKLEIESLGYLSWDRTTIQVSGAALSGSTGKYTVYLNDKINKQVKIILTQSLGDHLFVKQFIIPVKNLK